MTSQEERAWDRNARAVLGREIKRDAEAGRIHPAMVLNGQAEETVIRAMLALAAEVREECAIAARNALVAYEWPPQDGDAQCDAVLAAIRAQGGGRG